MTLDRNPENYFAQVEQLAFSPGNRVRGIEYSPDKVLQARIFAYADTQRHRLVTNRNGSFHSDYSLCFRIGVNYNTIPVNQPIAPRFTPTQRDGFMNTTDNYGSTPNYYPCSFMNARDNPARYNELRVHLNATDVDRFESSHEDNYTQIRDLYLSYAMDERNRLHSNIAGDLQYVYEFLQQRALDELEKIHTEYAAGVRRALENLKRMNAMRG